ncbi:hypothetical protein GGR52DRAFT_436998 [Hypoxylon sp. FL1284]|nr:hypothetical protein GGR52DRAFT_436998 [Hypoxylon sp. FL1284]
MATTSGTDREPGEWEEEEIIPPFQAMSPAIFVPAETDLTNPAPELPSEPSKLRDEMLAQVDEHADRVQDNMYYMIGREKMRILQEWRQREAHLPRRLEMKGGLTEADEQPLLNSTHELGEIFFIRSIVDIPKQGAGEVPADFTHSHCLHVEADGRFGETPRVAAERMMLNLAKHGVQNLEGFVESVRKVKEAKERGFMEGMRSAAIEFGGAAPADADMMDTS